MMPPDLTAADLRAMAFHVREAMDDLGGVPAWREGYPNGAPNGLEQLERAAGLLDDLAAEMEGGAQ